MCRGRAAVTPKACTDYADPDGMQSSSAATAECPLPRVDSSEFHQKRFKKSMNLMKLDELEMNSNEIYTYSAKPHFSAGRATLI
jgi:hypothetical protein